MKLAVMSKAIGAATLAFAIMAPVQAATRAATAGQVQPAPAMQLKRLADDYYMSKARFDRSSKLT